MKKYLLLSVLFILCASTITVAQSKKKKKQKKINTVIHTAESYKGTPYKYGGTSKSGIDCSALMQNSFSSAGYKIPRTAKEQSKTGKNISMGGIKPGDLVFFKFKDKRDKWYHSGLVTKIEGDHIYFVHASSSRGVVQSELTSNYYEPKIKAIRRIIK
ncbi:MAG: C40 family peptidase [Reichenbachiella sp.]